MIPGECLRHESRSSIPGYIDPPITNTSDLRHKENSVESETKTSKEEETKEGLADRQRERRGREKIQICTGREYERKHWRFSLILYSDLVSSRQMVRCSGIVCSLGSETGGNGGKWDVLLSIMFSAGCRGKGFDFLIKKKKNEKLF